MEQYYILYKPYGVLSQFSPEGGNPGLGDLYTFPKNVYPVGRLDLDSEGLLILTNDKKLNNLLLNPKNKHWRTYLIQVDGQITEDAGRKLEQGVIIKLNKKEYKTLPAKSKLMDLNFAMEERDPPIRFRKEIPTSWLELNLQEGKNRQVRRMTAAVGFPTLRLIRLKIEMLTLEGMKVGEVIELSKEKIYKLLKIGNKHLHENRMKY